MSTNVTMLEVFCLRQLDRIQDRNPLTFGASRRIKRNQTNEARPTKESNWLMVRQIAKAHRHE